MAYHNITTKLPNRKMFERFKINNKFVDKNGEIYLITICIENYDIISNNMGYDVALEYIEKFGKILENEFINIGEVFHFETNKFGAVFLVEDLKNINIIVERMKTAIEINKISFYSELSIGIAVYENGNNLEEILKKAETARNYSKNKLVDYIIYENSLEKNDIERMNVLLELKEAISKNQLELYFQPKVNISENKVYGAEALIRWKHPTKGLIPPIKFIPYLEETTLINDVTKWVIENTLKKIVQWNNEGIFIKVAVNISVTNLYDKEFISFIESSLKKYNVNSKSIEFEITEGKNIEHFDMIVGILKKVKNIGIKISIDDFGTGYSSLAYIKQLPIDSIKIDRIFINNINSDINNREIVSATISIAETFGLEVVAEGIESDKELDILKKLRCNIVQGFLFSKPLPDKEFIKWLRENNMF